MYIVVASIIIAFILYRMVTSLISKTTDFFEKADALKEIPCENRHWFFGNAKYYTADKIGMTREIKAMKTHPDCFQKWYGPTMMNVTGYRPEMGKILLSSDEPKSDFAFRYFIPWIGDGLLTSHGKKWKRNRRLLTPVFHFDSLKRYLPCVNEASMDMMRNWESDNRKSRSIEMFHDVSKATLDNLLRCLLSKHTGLDNEENMRYLKAVKCITKEIELRIRNPFYYFDIIYYRTAGGKRYREAIKIAHNFTEKAIRERTSEIMMADKCKSPAEYDFLDVLLMAKDENGVGLSHREIRDEMDTFIFEGHDTVTSGISWTLYNLALYPDMQERCRNEVIDVLNGGNYVEWKHLTKLEYLTKFLKESMRIFPPVLQVGRLTTKPMLFPHGFDSHHSSNGDISNLNRSRVFPKNVVLSMKMFLMHRNPDIWENPEVFDPERFSPENIAKRSPHAYIPFSAGTRNCIGQNFAMNEMKVMLAIALSMFRFIVDGNYPRPEIEPSVVLGSTTGIHLLVENL